MLLARRRFLTFLAALGTPAAAVAQTSVAPTVLKADKARAFLPGSGSASDILSFDGTANGPVLRIILGAALDLRLTNALDGPIALQWHGMRCPNAADGDIIAPGSTAAITFTPPDSGLYWFHPAAAPGQPDLTGEGLRGVLIVEEWAPPETDRDILVTVADWPRGSGGAPLTVNGKEGPERTTMTPGSRLRLRIVNASTGRIMIMAVEGARPLILAIDGQPSELFEPVRESVPVGPGARFEFMIDVPRDVGALVRLVLRGSRVGGATDADKPLLDIETQGAPRAQRSAIAALPRNRQLSQAIPLEQSVRADLTMAMVGQPPPGQPLWRLNGVADLNLPTSPLLSVKRGGTVTLGLTNTSAVPVALRVHGHVMRLLHGKDDGWEPYWRDSVLLPPNTVNHVAFVADNPGRWLIESAIFGQAAFGLRSWFQVS